MKKFWRWLVVIGLVAALMPVLSLNVAVADDATVGTGTPASCTEGAFDTALATAHLNGGGTITFNCGGPAAISFSSAKNIITTNAITIDGANEITINGTASTTGLFNVQNVATLDLIGLTLQHSTKTGAGAVIFSTGGNVSITRSTVQLNNATGGGAVGGAIFNAGGTVSIDSSTFYGNSAPESGGAIFHSGGILTITQSTFHNNSSTLASGGAIAQNSGMTTIEGATLSGNSAGGTGGAIAVLPGSSASISRSIVAGNTAPGGGANCFNQGTLMSLDYNLSNDATCSFTLANDIQNSANVNLGPFASNGGPTRTMLPADDSDAIDAAGDCAATEDQRGEERPVGDACDIGSVELQIPSATFTLCVNRYTGQLFSPFYGGCNPNSQFELVTPDAYPLAFCISQWTGTVSYSFGRPCGAYSQAHVVPDDGDLLTCVSRYTSRHRAVWSHSQCSSVELANTIYGTASI